METKKNSKFDLEAKRKTFFLFGLVLSLSAVLLAFKSSSEVREIDVPTNGAIVNPEPVIIPITREPVDRPPALPKFQLSDKIEIVENNTPEVPFEIDFPNIDDPLPDPIKIEEESKEETPLNFAQIMPAFPGGEQALNHWLSRNVHYPNKAQQLNIEGRVYLSFVVDKDGTISDVNITRGVDKILDEEAIRVVSSMPKWEPGFQNGQAVKVRFNLFITFKLN